MGEFYTSLSDYQERESVHKPIKTNKKKYFLTLSIISLFLSVSVGAFLFLNNSYKTIQTDSSMRSLILSENIIFEAEDNVYLYNSEIPLKVIVLDEENGLDVLIHAQNISKSDLIKLFKGLAFNF